MKPHPLIAQLIEQREALDLTRRDLTVAAGLAKATIAMAETGHRTPSLETIEVWAEALGYTIVLLPVGHKPCLDCGDIKPERYFAPDRRTRDGRATRCGACVVAAAPRKYLEVAA